MHTMSTPLLLLLVQGVLGAFDTLWYHEITAQLPSKQSASLELRLHAARDIVYAIIFGTLGWVIWTGVFAWCLFFLLLVEICITLWDFIEEDRTRKLPAGERVTHALMGIIYGAFIGYLIPEIVEWERQASGFVPTKHSVVVSWVFSVIALGLLGSGTRDLRASMN